MPARKKSINILIAVFLCYVLFFPAHFAHAVLIVTHAVVESIASVLEELLMHGLNLSKFQSQLIIVYLGFGISLYGAYRFCKRLPDIFNRFVDYFRHQYSNYVKLVIDNWKQLPLAKKIRSLLICFLGLFIAINLLS